MSASENINGNLFVSVNDTLRDNAEFKRIRVIIEQELLRGGKPLS